MVTYQNQSSLVDIDWGTDFKLRDLNSGRDDGLFCSIKVHTCSGDHPASYSTGTGVVSRGEVDHSTQSSADDKNERRCTSSPPICLHGMDRNNFTSVPFTSVNYQMILWYILMKVCNRRSALFSLHFVLSHYLTILLQSANIFRKLRPVVFISLFGSQQQKETEGYRQFSRMEEKLCSLKTLLSEGWSRRKRDGWIVLHASNGRETQTKF